MDYKEITLNNNEIIEGALELAQAVTVTLGPKGSTVIIPSKKEFGKYDVTKDGVSVAKSIEFKNPLKNIGASLVKEVSELTLKLAGDGTTTATVLTASLIKYLREFNYKEVEKELNDLLPLLIKELKNQSKEIDNSSVFNVAKISTNGDEHMSKLIKEAYDFSNIVSAEQSSQFEDSVLYIEGMSLNTGSFSKNFFNYKNKTECVLKEPKVLILSKKLTVLKGLETVLRYCSEQDVPLIIITEEVEEKVLKLLEANVLSNNIKLCVIKSPGFSTNRVNKLNDIAALTKSKIVHDLNVLQPISVLGTLKSFKCSLDNSLLLKSDDVDVSEYLMSLEEEFKSTSLENKDLLQERINNFKGKVSIIKVGGLSEHEVNERADRYDDAVKAVKCALEEGIVLGGGYALYDTSLKLYDLKDNDIYKNILKAVQTPFELITEDLNPITWDQNIVDPLKVTRTALENAFTVVKTILSTNAVVLNRSEWN